jgi:hypothetical protein
MVVTNKGRRMRNLGKNLTIREHNFEVVDEFKYLGTLVTIRTDYQKK